MNYNFFLQMRGKIKVTIRWNEPELSNGVIDYYDLRINCSNNNSNNNNDGADNDNNDGADNDNVNKECQENVRLKAREREFVFKEDAANSQVILHNNPRPIFLSFHSFQITFRIKTVYFRGSYLAYHATV